MGEYLLQTMNQLHQKRPTCLLDFDIKNGVEMFDEDGNHTAHQKPIHYTLWNDYQVFIKPANHQEK